MHKLCLAWMFLIALEIAGPSLGVSRSYAFPPSKMQEAGIGRGVAGEKCAPQMSFSECAIGNHEDAPAVCTDDCICHTGMVICSVSTTREANPYVGDKMAFSPEPIAFNFLPPPYKPPRPSC